MEQKGAFLGNTNSAKANRYKYNGKEVVEEMELSLSLYGARLLDPSLGRFTSIDQNSHLRNWINPFNYVQNNPLIRIDPDGKLDTLPSGKYIYDKGALKNLI